MAVAFVTMAAAATWWLWPSTGEPTISFIGFREEKGQRIALFSLRNPSSAAYEISGQRLVESYATGAARTWTIGERSDWAWRYSDPTELSPHAGVILPVQLGLALRHAEWVGRSFRFGVTVFERPREPLAFLPEWLRSWFPESMRAPAPQQVEIQPKILWSEVVMP